MKLVDVQAAKETARIFLPDIFLQMAVDRALDATPEFELPRGRWIEERDDYMICATFFTCSNCKESFCNSDMDDKEFIATMKYCPNCGADMR